MTLWRCGLVLVTGEIQADPYGRAIERWEGETQRGKEQYRSEENVRGAPKNEQGQDEAVVDRREYCDAAPIVPELELSDSGGTLGGTWSFRFRGVASSSDKQQILSRPLVNAALYTFQLTLPLFSTMTADNRDHHQPVNTFTSRSRCVIPSAFSSVSTNPTSRSGMHSMQPCSISAAVGG